MQKWWWRDLWNSKYFHILYFEHIYWATQKYVNIIICVCRQSDKIYDDAHICGYCHHHIICTQWNVIRVSERFFLSAVFSIFFASWTMNEYVVSLWQLRWLFIVSLFHSSIVFPSCDGILIHIVVWHLANYPKKIWRFRNSHRARKCFKDVK